MIFPTAPFTFRCNDGLVSHQVEKAPVSPASTKKYVKTEISFESDNTGCIRASLVVRRPHGDSDDEALDDECERISIRGTRRSMNSIMKDLCAAQGIALDSESDIVAYETCDGDIIGAKDARLMDLHNSRNGLQRAHCRVTLRTSSDIISVNGHNTLTRRSSSVIPPWSSPELEADRAWLNSLKQQRDNGYGGFV